MAMQLSRFRAKSIYFISFLETLTPAKFLNYLLNAWEYRLGRRRLSSFPPQLIIDLTNTCNLHCPVCPTGMKLANRRKGIMSIQSFSDLINQIKNRVLAVHLYNWGEPLRLPDFTQYCAVAKAAGLVVSTSSNLNVTIDYAKAQELVSCGLDRLLISFDGIQESTYSLYRKGGCFETVIANIGKLVEAKSKGGLRRPVIELIFVKHRRNAEEAKYLASLCRKMKIDSFRVVDILLPLGHESDDELKKRWIEDDRLSESAGGFEITADQLGRRCFHLWKSPVVNWDLTVSPCCYVYDVGDDFSDLGRAGFAEAWNSQSFIRARNMFAQKYSEPIAPCCRCGIYGAYR